MRMLLLNIKSWERSFLYRSSFLCLCKSFLRMVNIMSFSYLFRLSFVFLFTANISRSHLLLYVQMVLAYFIKIALL
jgi:hypothetical protein